LKAATGSSFPAILLSAQVQSFASSPACPAATTISVACSITASNRDLRDSSVAMARAIITAPTTCAIVAQARFPSMKCD